MLVRAKTKDIAILRTMGATRMSLMRIFMPVGTLIGALGIIAGLGLGFLILHFRPWTVGGVGFVTCQNPWAPSIRYPTELPAKPDPLEVPALVIMAPILSFMSTPHQHWNRANTKP